jgi:hypothetical protein
LYWHFGYDAKNSIEVERSKHEKDEYTGKMHLKLQRLNIIEGTTL